MYKLWDNNVDIDHYFDQHVCLSIRPSGVSHKNFFSLKSPWNHPLTPGFDPGYPEAPSPSTEVKKSPAELKPFPAHFLNFQYSSPTQMKK